MGRKRPTESLLELPVQYGNVNIGDKTAQIGVTIARKDLSLAKADGSLVEKRLTGTITATAWNDNPDQPELLPAGVELTGVFDVKSFGVTKKHISTGLTFSIASIDIESLAHFAKAAGKLIVQQVEDIPEEQKVPAPSANGEEEEGE